MVTLRTFEATKAPLVGRLLASTEQHAPFNVAGMVLISLCACSTESYLAVYLHNRIQPKQHKRYPVTTMGTQNTHFAELLTGAAQHPSMNVAGDG